MNVKKYVGRQLRPSQLAAELLPPDQRWCATCHRTFPKQQFSAHVQSPGHRLTCRKMDNLKRLSLGMWEEHRGAPLSEGSAHEPVIEDEYRRFRADQKRREQAAGESWRASQTRRSGLL